MNKMVRRFIAKRSVLGSKAESSEGEEFLIKEGVTYLEIRPGSGILRPEDDPIATYGLSLDLVKDHGGIPKYFDELESILFRDTKYFEEYVRYWETDIQQKYKKILESLKELNNFSQMIGKPQYSLRVINKGSKEYWDGVESDLKLKEESKLKKDE